MGEVGVVEVGDRGGGGWWWGMGQAGESGEGKARVGVECGPEARQMSFVDVGVEGAFQVEGYPLHATARPALLYLSYPASLAPPPSQLHPSDGSPASATTWRYKVPGVYCVPQALRVSLLRDSPLHLQGPISCKAVGEPPLLLASGVLLALQQAAMAARADKHGVAQGQGETNGHKGAGYKPLCAPATPEAIRTYLSS